MEIRMTKQLTHMLKKYMQVVNIGLWYIDMFEHLIP